MRKVPLAVMMTMALLAGCGPGAADFTDADRAAVAAEIRAARDAYFRAATVTMDADAMVALWDKDFVHVSNAYLQPLTLEDLREGWKTLSHIDMDITSDRVVALSTDSGYTLTTASYTVFDAAGTVIEKSDWAGTHIWVRTDAGWKVHAVMEGRPVAS